jgi:hypothetical protein
VPEIVPNVFVVTGVTGGLAWWLWWWLGAAVVGGALLVPVLRRRRLWRRPPLGRRARPEAAVVLELLTADRLRRRALEGELRTALWRLQQVLGPALPAHLAVVVQDTICGDGALAGCTHVGARPGGVPYALVRLAFTVNGQPLATDQVLAVLAEQCLALAGRGDIGTTVVLPVELPALIPVRPSQREAPPNGAPHRATATEATGATGATGVPGVPGALRPDPLAAPRQRPPAMTLAPLAAPPGRDGLPGGSPGVPAG